MSVYSGQTITKEFRTRDFTTGELADADFTPSGTLYVDGAAGAAAVTVTRQSAGRYDAAVTLPTLQRGSLVDLEIAATVGGVSDAEIIWSDTVDAPADAPAAAVITGTAVGDALAANALGPREVETDAGRVQQHSLADQIEADRYIASKAAAAAGRPGIRFRKLVPPGAD